MQRSVVLDVVGLTQALLGPDTPHLTSFAERGAMANIETITPAVTCSVQSTFVTGEMPSGHGCVGNGWLFRELSQVWLWRQSNKLVQGEKVWEAARRRDPSFTCAKLFWWYNMYADVDWAVTPRPIYRANGRKLPDIHTAPGELRDRLQNELGTFPLFSFWGPRANIESSRWIAQCALEVERTHQPTLNLVYIPHLDYALQKFGPNTPEASEALREVDGLCGELIAAYEAAGLRVIILSEYGITPVRAPIHINRALREAGFLSWRVEEGEEHIDVGASRAFALADHQVAHVYVRNSDDLPAVKSLLEGLDGVETVLDEEGKRARGLEHDRSGELVLIAEADRWFTYYFWLDDAKAPDYARTVDIHSKPGYDPAELFIDPKISLPMVKVASWMLRSKVLNQRALLDVIPLDASLVKGSHGRITDRPEDGPLLITNAPQLLNRDSIAATQVKELMLSHLFDTGA
jgi:predicted AlkP superfamily pyrophosphatase or phosphodiesterase